MKLNMARSETFLNFHAWVLWIGLTSRKYQHSNIGS
jgi:hypothetical protein